MSCALERDSGHIPSERVGPTPLAADQKVATHVPVLLDAVIEALAPRDGGVYVDGTFGAGGYSAALLAAARCRVVGIDRDPDALRRGAGLAAAHPGRLQLVEGRFGDMERLLAAASPDSIGGGPIAGVALDLGISSPQLDAAERGFSFRLDGPLDMRMGGDGESAADLVARLGEDELEQVIRRFGEERFARRVARAIVAARQCARFAAPASWPRSCAPRFRSVNPELTRPRAHFRRCASRLTTNCANSTADWRRPSGCWHREAVSRWFRFTRSRMPE